jgi:RimJ/RimL family protein N-acetyltransferase
MLKADGHYLLLRHAFDALRVYRVERMTAARNLCSQRAIERLGASREGILRCHMICPDGYRRDSVFYSILDHEWPTVKARLEPMLASS